MKAEKQHPKRSRVLLGVLLAVALAACDGKIGNRDIEGDQGSGGSDDSSEPGVALTLNLVVSGLPDGAQATLTVNEDPPVVLTNGSVPVSVASGDILKLGAVTYAEGKQQDRPYDCGFDAGAGNGTLSDRALTLTRGRDATQPVMCGEVQLMRRAYLSALQEGWLRVSLGSNQAAWLTDADGQVMIASLRGSATMQDDAALNGKLVFAAYTEEYGMEPWVTDGTPAGTHLLVDLETGATGSSPQSFFSIGDGKVYFWALVDGVYRIYETDGTEAGTKALDVPGVTGSYGQNRVVAGSKLYFTDSARMLYVKDAAGVRSVVTMTAANGGGLSGNPAFYGISGDRIVFSRSGNLWVSDGTEGGTHIIEGTDVIYRGAPAAVFNGVFYFTGYTAEHGYEPWRSDGTGAGTYMLSDIIPGVEPTTAPATTLTSFTSASDGVYFVAEDLDHGKQLWKTRHQADGRDTATMVKQVIYIDPAADTTNTGSGRPTSLRIAGNYVVFLASATNAIWPDFWTSDGTEEGTSMLFNTSDSRWAETRNRRYMESLGGKKVLFSNYSLLLGTYLDRYWISDGTATGSGYLLNDKGAQFQHSY